MIAACHQCRAPLADPASHFCGHCGADLQRASDGNLAQDDALLGRVIDGRYRVLERIGEGAMGTVFKVEHTAIGKLAAMKMLHPALSRDRDIVKRFRLEAEAISLLAHPGTVQVFDFGEYQGCLFMVMEFLRGEDLGRILTRDGPMAWSRAAPILLQICDALGAAHEAGIVHRDLKPENVLLSRGRDGRDVVKVLDFGLAKLRQREDLSGVTAQGSLVGTPYYMSPEQIRSEEPDQRSDIYSFGALTYRMLTGQPPYPGASPLAVLTQHLSEALVLPSVRCPDLAIDPRVEAMIARCLQKAPADRYRSFGEVAAAIATTLGAERQRPTVPTASERRVLRATSTRLSRVEFDEFERGLRRQKWIRGVAVPLVIASSLGTVGWSAYLRSARPAAVSDEVEPNNQADQANPIASGQTVHGTIGQRLNLENSDRDFFTFEVAAPSLLDVTLGPIPNMDLHLGLFDGTGTKVAEQNGGGPGQGEHLADVRLAPGRFYLEVREVWVAGRQATENVTDRYALTATWRALAK